MRVIIIPRGKTLFTTAGNYTYKGPMVLTDERIMYRRFPPVFTDGTPWEFEEIGETKADMLAALDRAKHPDKPKEPETLTPPEKPKRRRKPKIETPAEEPVNELPTNEPSPSEGSPPRAENTQEDTNDGGWFEEE